MIRRHAFSAVWRSGEEMWAQAWSEPDAGLRHGGNSYARCARRRKSMSSTAKKTWSTRAVFADWAFCLLRSKEGSTRHHGLSFILVPLSADGVTVRPIRQLNGLPGFAEIFFDDVRVPVFNRIGEEGQGWRIAMATAGFERGLMLRSPARFQETARRLVELYRHRRDELVDPSNSGLGTALLSGS